MAPKHRPSRALRNAPIVLPFLLLIVLGLAGCQLLPRQPAPEPEPPIVLGPPDPGQAGADGAGRLVDAVDRLQNGQFEAAADILGRLRELSPGSPTLALLARQLEAPPERILPGPYRVRVVAPGDTLSEIAEEELGNPLLFVALARLNDIAVPRALPVGVELRVPETAPGEERPQPTEPDVEATAAVSETAPDAEPRTDATADAGAIDAGDREPRRSELETVAEYLLASGQPTDARELLLAAARNRSLTPPAEQLLAELALDASRTEVAEGRFDDAIATLAEVDAALAPGPARARLDARRDRIEVQSLMDRAAAFEERGLLIEAYRLAEDALTVDDEFAPAVALEADLRERLVETYHDRALRAWRSRDIDLAIRTWRELLDVVPDFEPAGVYLERAQRLRARLNEPQ